MAFVGDIEELTLNNNNFRKTLDTGSKMQLVLMTLLPGEQIGEEVHTNMDQFFRIESGLALAVVDGKLYKLKSNDVIIVHAKSKHNIINRSRTKPLKLYSLYAYSKTAPHAPKCIQKRSNNTEC